jgi:hypothetical protein
MNWIPIPRTAINEERPEPIATGMELVGEYRIVEVSQVLSHLALFDTGLPRCVTAVRRRLKNCPPSKEGQSHDS